MLLAENLKVVCLFISIANIFALHCDISDQQRSNINDQASNFLLDDFKGEYVYLEGELFFNQNQLGNPDGKYGVIDFPWSARPLFLNLYCKIYGERHNFNQEETFCGVFYDLGASDALVWLACLPPEVEYFSLSVHLGIRFEPSFWGPLAQFGDSINQLVINTTAAPSETPFCKTALFIATADAVTFRAIRDSYVKAGFPESAINMYPIPDDLPNFKSGIWAMNKYDLFGFQFRVNGISEDEAQEEYFQGTQEAFLVRRKRGWWDVGLWGSSAPREPMPLPEPRPRGDGTSEIVNHAGAFQELKEAIQETFQVDGYELVYSFDMVHKVPNITRCMVDNEYAPAFPAQATQLFNTTTPGCDWFTTDALYTFPPDNLDVDLVSMTSSRVFVVVGLNQVLMGKCLYYNFLFGSAMNGEFEMPGHGFDFSCSDAEGSATRFAPAVENVDKMITWTFARPGFCMGKKWCTEFNNEEIGGLIYTVERKYLEPSTRIGPSSNEVLAPSVLIFDSIYPSVSSFS
mmetsp:Transcript_27687/g.36004  ORF Transcript_27687/g.36004 Transcript_27687/m.36004 type:complete len:516 (-) Transcript_27687:171-1718(-)